jgi:DNA-binding LacI/PurR family transcriptional regulator
LRITEENRRITIKDVAREAGVSHVTVSYVLNNTPGRTISEETSARVLAAVRKLDYRPYAPARSLRSGKSKIVLVTWPYGVAETGFSEFIEAMTIAVSAIGFSLVTQIGYTPENNDLAVNLSPAVVVGLMLEYDPEVVASLQRFNVPLILAGNADQPEQGPSLQVDYLVQRGRRQIVFAATDKPQLQSLCQKRLEVVRAACRKHTLLEPRTVVIPESRNKARQVMKDLLTELPPPFGVCAFNDDVALPVLAALADLKVAVPGDVSVIGHDNSKIGEFCYPALTTISHESPEYIEEFIANIISVCQGAPLVEQMILRPKVVERESA